MPTIDVIIPTYRPGKELLELVRMLSEQTRPVNRIIIMNTEEKYFERLIYGSPFYKRYRNVSVYHVSRREFDHGGTRHLGVQYSEAEYFICLTQDAMPCNDGLVEALYRALQTQDTAVAYGRQLPREDCRMAERFTRSFNYPAEGRIKSLEDLPELGIKTYFCSNVCAAYRREIYDRQGGFIHPTIFNEDMIYAAGAIRAGYRVVYEPKAQVVHSHNYTGREQFHRNFDLGVSQAQHPEIFAGVPSEGEGLRMVRQTAAYLKQNKRAGQIPALLYQSACKYAGYRFGKTYRKLPKKWVIQCSMNKNYWQASSDRNIQSP